MYAGTFGLTRQSARLLWAVYCFLPKVVGLSLLFLFASSGGVLRLLSRKCSNRIKGRIRFFWGRTDRLVCVMTPGEEGTTSMEGPLFCLVGDAAKQ